MIPKPAGPVETSPVLGLFPADDFVVTTGEQAAQICTDDSGVPGSGCSTCRAVGRRAANASGDFATDSVDTCCSANVIAGNGTGSASDASGACLPAALWLFRHETIAIPRDGTLVARYAPDKRPMDDLVAWSAKTPLGEARDYPCVVWLGAADVVRGARLDRESERWLTPEGPWQAALVEKIASNRAFCDESSLAFFERHAAHLRGAESAVGADRAAGGLAQSQRCFTVQCYWPEDYRIDASAVRKSSLSASPPLAATPAAVRDFVRQTRLPAGSDPAGEFVVRSVWQRDPAVTARRAGRPMLGLMLNGAQGDDDEAHAGHFALLSGRLGPDGEMHDWLVANFYTLDSESEKGILAGMRPLDGYLGDLNSGQAWYRPSWLLVAVLRDERTAVHLTSALARLFNQYYRNPASYQHAAANCTGLCLSALRAIGWQVPRLGPTSWWRAFAALPAEALRTRRLAKGKVLFDYLTEERTRLFPALAFEQAAADLLGLVRGETARALTPYEAGLRDDVDEILLVHVPQFPSSRAWGGFPVAGLDEYRRRLPADPAQQQIIPVPPRVFPPVLADRRAPRPAPARSDYAVALGGVLLVAAGAWALLRCLSSRSRRAGGRRVEDDDA